MAVLSLAKVLVGAALFSIASTQNVSVSILTVTVTPSAVTVTDHSCPTTFPFATISTSGPSFTLSLPESSSAEPTTSTAVLPFVLSSGIPSFTEPSLVASSTSLSYFSSSSEIASGTPSLSETLSAISTESSAAPSVALSSQFSSGSAFSSSSEPSALPSLTESSAAQTISSESLSVSLSLFESAPLSLTESPTASPSSIAVYFTIASPSFSESVSEPLSSSQSVSGAPPSFTEPPSATIYPSTTLYPNATFSPSESFSEPQSSASSAVPSISESVSETLPSPETSFGSDTFLASQTSFFESASSTLPLTSLSSESSQPSQIISSTFEPTLTLSTLSASLIPTMVPTDGFYNEVGCYDDTAGNGFPEINPVYQLNVDTIDECLDLCSAGLNGPYQYGELFHQPGLLDYFTHVIAGVEGTACFCANDFNSNATQTPGICSKPCAGDPSQMCGGKKRKRDSNPHKRQAGGGGLILYKVRMIASFPRRFARYTY